MSFFGAMRACLGLAKGAELFCTFLPPMLLGLRSPVTVATLALASCGFGLLMGGAMRAVLTESMGPAGLAGFIVPSGQDFGLLTVLAGRTTARDPLGLLDITVFCPVLLEGGPIGLLAMKEPRARLAALTFPAACLEALVGTGGVTTFTTFGREEFPPQEGGTLGLLGLLEFPRLCQFVRPIIGLARVGCERWTTFVRCAAAGLVFLTC